MMWDGQEPYPWYTVDDSIVLIQPWHTQTWNEPHWKQQWGTQDLLPWWFRPSWAYTGRGWFTDAYPVLSPYYSIWTPNPEWIDAWSMQPYQGMW